MIDLHCHILPGIDDGPSDPNESLLMCQMAADDGIRVIVATPHLYNGDSVNTPEAITAMVTQFNGMLAQRRIGVRIIPGMEIPVIAEVLDFAATGKVLALNRGRYFLVEFLHGQLPAGFEHLVKRLAQQGYGVVLAHPEKNIHIQRNPQYVMRLLAVSEPWSVLAQVSADSLTGEAGAAAAKTVRILLHHQAVHIIASDAHSSVERPPRLSQAVAEAAKIVGQEYATQMVSDLPKAVLDGLGFPRLAALQIRKRWWNRLGF